ncbi:MAG: stage III sporulation protein AB [Coprococcus sp.]
MLTGAVFIKVIGAICVISGCAGTGLSVSRAYGRRYRQLGILRQMAVLLRGEIRYACSELPEAFEHVAWRIEDPFQSFLKGLADELRLMDGEPFDALWKKHVEESLSVSCLAREDREALFRLGGQMGFLDREMQLAAIDLYLDELDASMLSFGQTISQKQKLSLSLGILSGLFLTALLA